MEKQTVSIGLHYGALSDPIEKQLNSQGFTLGTKQDFIEQLQHGLNMCMFHLLTDAQHAAALKKFHKIVMKAVKPLPQE